MQNFLTPSVQFFGIEPAAVSIADTALVTALWASLIILEVAVAATLAALWAWVAAVEMTPRLSSGFDGTERVTLREGIFIKSN
jgi:hypothetical protein